MSVVQEQGPQGQVVALVDPTDQTLLNNEFFNKCDLLIGLLANIPALKINQIFFATDSKQTFIGLPGGNTLMSSAVTLNPATKLLYVDNSRTDNYTPSGSFSQPFKTIADAVAKIASNGDNGSVGYLVQISPGVYAETISLSASGLVNITFVGFSVIVTGGTTAVNNDGLTDVKFIGIKFFGGSHIWTSSTNGTNFLNGNVYNIGLWFLDCWFNSGTGVTFTDAGGVTLENCNITMPMVFTNVVQTIAKGCVLNQGSSFDAVTNAANPAPNGWTNTTIQYRFCSAQATSNIGVGSTLIAQFSRVRGAVTVSGLYTARANVTTGAITVNSGGTYQEDEGAGHSSTLTVNAGGNYTQTGTIGTGVLKMNGVTVQAGSGVPNGSVLGSPGDVYINTAGGALTTFWVKETGILTNTGWIGK